MKKIIAIALLAALAAQGAMITSKDGRIVDAEVLSYKDGVFSIRSEGREYEIRADDLKRIDFEIVEPEPEGELASAPKPRNNIKVDISKVSIHYDKIPYGIYLRPELKIDFRTPATKYKIRPVIEMLILTERKESKTLELHRMYFVWDKGWVGYRPEGYRAINIKELSEQQPFCDWKDLSPENLSGRDGSSGLDEDRFTKAPAIMAHKVCVWLDGEVIAESEEIKTRKPIPKDWTAI